MKKIPSLFIRDWDGDRSRVTNVVNPECLWVAQGFGVATRKWDGTCVKFEDGKFFKRYDAKHGKIPPAGFIPAQPDTDPESGHWPGWLLVDPEDKANKWFMYALNENGSDPISFASGTYELCGPKFQSNPEKFDRHYFMPHGKHQLPFAERSFNGVKSYLEINNIEGIVWHHPDGRMAKIKGSDFGIKR